MPNNFTPQFSYTDLTLTAVALCPQGANSRANILLTKSMKEGAKQMEFKDILAGLTADAQKVITDYVDTAKSTAVNEAVAPLNTKISELTTANEQLTAAVNKSAPQPKMSEDVMKSLPAEVQAQITAMQKSISALEAEKAENLAKSRFAVVKAIPCEEAELKSVLKTASPEVFAVLAKAATAIEEGLGKSTAVAGEGTITVSSDDAYKALEKKAADIAKAENVSSAQAFTKACELHPDLYEQYVKGE